MRSASLIPAGLAIVASTYGLARYAYGLFLPNIQADFQLSTAVLGLIAGGSYAGYLVATLAGSAMSGVLGPRLPVVLGGLFATLGMTLIGVATDPWLLTLGVVVAGSSPGLAYPPLSDAVVRMVRVPRQNRAYAVINSGTSLGVVIAGPIALLAGVDWRWAWLCFAGFAFASTLWNGWLLPVGAFGGTRARLPRLHWGWFVHDRSAALFLSATLFGVVTSVYWTFAVDLLWRFGALTEFQTRAFWVLIGIAGFLGGFAGDLVTRFGLRRVFRVAVLGTALSFACLIAEPSSAGLASFSGVLFGGTFILVTGLFGIWSVNVFQDRPSAGFGATFFLISAGQLVGPIIAGQIAGAASLVLAFQVALALCVLNAFIVPRIDLFGMSATAAPKKRGVGPPARTTTATTAGAFTQGPTGVSARDR